MNKEKQIDEMSAEIQKAVNGCASYWSGLIAKHLYDQGYRKQSEVDLREEVTTDDFQNLELVKERGYHRKRFYCPNCDLLIKTETWDSRYMFGSGTILKTNKMPHYCPDCGAKMRRGE